MNRSVMTCWLLTALTLNAQPGPGGCCACGMGKATGAAPIAGNPVVEVTGTIAEVHIGAGQGMPYVEVRKGGETTRLYLGAIHYLIAQDFNPKTGQQISAKGYKVADGAIGIQVSLPAEKKTVKLRDEKGWPLWRGGQGRHGAQPAPAQEPAGP